MTSFTSAALAGLTSLAAHGASILTDSGMVPLTVDLCTRELESLQRIPAATSLNYDMLLPDVAAAFMLVINRDGSTEAGSKEVVEEILRHR